jgi:hypothetical protein
MTGWCVKCRKVKQVEVSGNGMAMLASGNVVHGLCQDCQKKERKRAGKAE